MTSVLVKIDNCNGIVSFECNTETGVLLTTLKWYDDEHDEGFEVVEDSIDVYHNFVQGIRLSITDVASEIFLISYLAAICEFYDTDIKDVTYIADDGININTLAFIPPSITLDEEEGDILCREFPELQAALRDVWMDYKQDNMLTIAEIDAASNRNVLEDFLSLINLQTTLNFGELENEDGITA